MLSDRSGNKPSSSTPEPIFSKKCSRTTKFWLIAVCFVSVWMFFLGILIGRGTLPFLSNPTQSELIALGSRQIPDKQISETTPVVSRIKFFEALKGTDPIEDDLPHIPPEPEAGKAKPTISPEASTQTKPQPAPVPTPIKPQTPVATAQPVPPKPQVTTPPPPAPAPAPAKETASEKWTLQIMATKSEAEAQAVAKKLSAKGYSVHVQKADIPNQGLMYRVQVGTFSNRAAAEVIQGNLKKEGYAPIIKIP